MTELLFQPNNHSVFAITYRPAVSETAQKLAAFLLLNYPFKEIRAEDIVQVNETEQASNNFRVPIVTDKGELRVLLVRKHILLAEASSVLLLEKTLRYLSENNVEVPRLLQTRAGAGHIETEGHLWQVFEFIDGAHYTGTGEELVSAAEGFASLHLALANFPYEEEVLTRLAPLEPFSDEALERVLRAAERNQNDIDAVFIEYASALRGFASARERFGEGGARRQIVHGDLHPHNTLFSDHKLRAILDFDMLQNAELLRDVGFAAHRFSRQHAVHERGGADHAVYAFNRFIAAYRAKNALTDTEVPGIFRYMLDELLRRVVTDFSRYYFEDITRYATAEELRKKVALLNEALWLSKHALIS